MADADIPITAGAGTKVDTRTVGAGADEHRQVVAIGDPATAANVALVDANGNLLTVVEGDVAHDAPNAGDPIQIGGYGANAAPAAVSADGDRVRAWFTRKGELQVATALSGVAADAVGNNWAFLKAENGGNAPLAIVQTAFGGSTWDRVRIPNVFKTIAGVAVTAGTPVNVWTPATGKKFRLMGYALGLTVAGAVILLDNTTEILRTAIKPANDGMSSPPMGNGILSAAANNILKVNVTATGTVHGFVFGTEE